MKKHEKNTGLSNLEHGRHSKTVKALQERMHLLPLDDIKKMEFETMLDQMTSTSWAFDFDKLIKTHLIEGLQDTDKKLMSYTADLANTQMRIAKSEKDAAFHNKVLLDLKTEYIKEEDSIIKKSLYADIQECEKTLATFERRVSEYIDLRNKIRKEIDKGKYQSKALKIKEEEMQGIGAKVIDVDVSVL